MEQETIIYFYPVSEEKGIPGNLNAVRGFWSRRVSLDVRILGGVRDEFNVAGCAVPPFYRQNRPWKPQLLSETMEKVVHSADGLADVIVNPQIASMLADGYGERWTPRNSTMRRLMGRLLEQYAPDTLMRCGEAAVLLGEPGDIQWQMDMAGELLQPYLHRVNKLLVFYEETAETDIWVELGDHLDDYYYDFGLVPQLEAYADTENGKRCRKHRCQGAVIDFGTQYRYPGILPDGRTVYIDAVSSGDKERLLNRKTPRVQYASPLKYLDTMVKNSYDRLVN